MTMRAKDKSVARLEARSVGRSEVGVNEMGERGEVWRVNSWEERGNRIKKILNGFSISIRTIL